MKRKRKRKGKERENKPRELAVLVYDRKKLTKINKQKE